MLAASLAALLAAAPPASKADSLAAGKQWEELYLAFAATAPDGYAAADKRRVARALAAGCAALLPEDAVMAYSLGEKSVAFEASAEGLLCAGLGAKKSDQRGAAEELLQRGVKGYPKDAKLKLELGRFLLEDGDPKARAALEDVPKKAREYKEAQALLAQAKALASRDSAARGEAKAQERELVRRQGGEPPVEPAPGPEARPGGAAPPVTGTGNTYESSVDGEGRRVRANSHFRFRYFNGQRDFGQRADYEGTVQAALEEARVSSGRILGRSRESALDIILYSHDEFAMHHGAQLAMAVAGFYSENAIRMNDSAELTPTQRAVLVHEYVHAVVDEVAGFRTRGVPVWLNEGLAELTKWRYEGRDQATADLRQAMQQLALQARLPPLKQMSRGPLIGMSDPAIAYAVAATAVKLLVDRGGFRDLLELIAEVGGGADFDKAFESHYGRDLDAIQDELTRDLKHK